MEKGMNPEKGGESMKLKLSAVFIAILCFLPHKGYLKLDQQANAQETGGERMITVLNPLGTPPSIILHPMAPRLNTLEGKTIYIVDDGYLGGDNLLLEMVNWFKKEMPKTNVLFRKKGGMGFDTEDPFLWAEMEKKADAMIIGIGH